LLINRIFYVHIFSYLLLISCMVGC
jgi:hypothetical protein